MPTPTPTFSSEHTPHSCSATAQGSPQHRPVLQLPYYRSRHNASNSTVESGETGFSTSYSTPATRVAPPTSTRVPARRDVSEVSTVVSLTLSPAADVLVNTLHQNGREKYFLLSSCVPQPARSDISQTLLKQNVTTPEANKSYRDVPLLQTWRPINKEK